MSALDHAGPGDDDAETASPSWIADDAAQDTKANLFDSSDDDETPSSWVEEDAPATDAASEPSPAVAPPKAAAPVERGKMKASALDDLFSRAKALKKKP